MNTQVSEPVLDEVENLDYPSSSDHVDPVGSEGTPGTKTLSERDFKIAYAKAVKERKEVIRRNKELIADKELEVAYWKAEADLMRYRFEKMDFFLKNIEIEPKYLMETEKIKAQQENQDLELGNKQSN